jgi:hypothetical protein
LLEVRQKAEELAFYAYVKAGKMKEAENHLNNIKSELTPDKTAAMEKMLKGE